TPAPCRLRRSAPLAPGCPAGAGDPTAGAPSGTDGAPAVLPRMALVPTSCEAIRGGCGAIGGKLLEVERAIVIDEIMTSPQHVGCRRRVGALPTRLPLTRTG